MLPNSGGTMQVYLPSNYTATQKWATVFFYHYMGGTPDTSFLRGLTEGRDYIVAGMSYLDDARPASPVQDTESYMRRELANYRSARNWLIAHASVDEARIFLAGTSKGGWAASGLGELELPRLGGIIILLAGRPYGFGRSPSPDALHGKPIYIGTGETDPNNMAARLARELYRRNGAVVTFEEYAGRGHEVPSDEKRLRAWLEANGPRRDRLSQPADRKELSAELEKSRAAAMAEADPSTQYSRLLDLADDPRLPLCEAGVSAQIQRQLAALRGRPPEADEWAAASKFDDLVYRDACMQTLAEMKGVLDAFQSLAQAYPHTRYGKRAAQWAVTLGAAYQKSADATRRANDEPRARTNAPSLKPSFPVSGPDRSLPPIPVRRGNKVTFEYPDRKR